MPRFCRCQAVLLRKIAPGAAPGAVRRLLRRPPRETTPPPAPGSTRSKGVDAWKPPAGDAYAAFAKVTQGKIGHRCRQRVRIGVVLIEQRHLQVGEKTGEPEVDVGPRRRAGVLSLVIERRNLDS